MAEQKNENSKDDSKIDISTDKPVDIDSIQVSVLLIVKSQSQFGAISQYLERRNWRVKVVSDMGEAITQLAKFQPDFVFISFNHPNPKLLKLPAVLAQTFNTHCVGFCETPDLRTESKLTSSKIKYKLVGAASGPSIQRRVKQILAEQYGVADQGDPTSLSKNNFGEVNESSVRVSGGAPLTSKEGLAYIPKAQEKQNKISGVNLLKQLQKAMEENSEEDEAQVGNSENSIVQATSQFEKPNNPEYISPNDVNNSKKVDVQISKENDSKTHPEYMDESGKSKRPESIIQEGVKSSNFFVMEESEERSKQKITEGDKMDKELFAEIEQINPGETQLNKQEILPKLSKEPVESQKLENDQRLNQKNMELDVEKNSLEEEKDFLYEALKNSMSKMSPSERQEDLDFKKIKKFGVIPVFDKELNGFIILASTVSKNFDLISLNHFRKSTLGQISSLGKHLQLGEPIEVSTEAVDIVDWTEMMAEIVLAGSLGRGYSLVAFMKAEFELPKLITDNEKNKLIIPFDLIVPGISLRFSTSIFMDKNNKFINYSRPGRKLTIKQISNLLQNKKELYLDIPDQNKFNEYCIEIKLNSMVEFFHKREAEKVS